MDEEESSSVTAAVVNVVCELGWRRPRDFLSLAPRLFELLVLGGNNWMAIKIIKLFAVLTPLEPRLIKKLLPPLTDLIKTTPAMSLLYECINGVIQGGVLEGSDGIREGEEIALLCVQKLRGMIVLDGDPNLKYVSLLAFTRILASHPHLVSTQQDVILNCVDDQDISIRLQAIELGAGMVNSENLVVFVDRLIQQLRSAPLSNGASDDQRQHPYDLEPAADSDGEDPEEALRSTRGPAASATPLPTDYRINVIRKILNMCSKDTYNNITDFEWYIQVLMQMIKQVPVLAPDANREGRPEARSTEVTQEDVSNSIGKELRNIAVRVSAVRSDVVESCESIIRTFREANSSDTSVKLGSGLLAYAAYVVGEYVQNCAKPYDALDSLLITKTIGLSAETICSYIQAILKVFSRIVSQHPASWDTERRTACSLLISRVISFLEKLSTHPNLEVQERSVEFLELMRVASQALPSDGSNTDQSPLLLTKAIPSLFQGIELNPVALSAQVKVPIPEGLDLEAPINPRLHSILQTVGKASGESSISTDFDTFYNVRPAPKAVAGPAIENLPAFDTVPSYQQSGNGLLHPEDIARRRMERRDRNKDDPFYIGGEDASSGTSTPFHDILQASNGEVFDVDSIPIMSLELGEKLSAHGQAGSDAKKQPRRSKKVHIAKDETLGGENEAVDSATELGSSNGNKPPFKERPKKSLLEVDSTNLGNFSLTEPNEPSTATGSSGVNQQDTEMAKALAEVERLRLEMQRASERIQASDGAPAEGTLVKKKKKKRSIPSAREKGPDDSSVPQDQGDPLETVVKKKKKKKRKDELPSAAMMTNDENDGEATYQG